MLAIGDLQSVIRGRWVSLSTIANLPIYRLSGTLVLESSGRKTIFPKYGESSATSSLLILPTVISISMRILL